MGRQLAQGLLSFPYPKTRSKDLRTQISLSPVAEMGGGNKS